VLKRSVQCKIIAYPETIIAFKEGLRHIAFHFNLSSFSDKVVTIHEGATIPKDSRKAFL
jgi:hypothetical protein